MSLNDLLEFLYFFDLCDLYGIYNCIPKIKINIIPQMLKKIIINRKHFFLYQQKLHVKEVHTWK